MHRISCFNVRDISEGVCTRRAAITMKPPRISRAFSGAIYILCNIYFGAQQIISQQIPRYMTKEIRVVSNSRSLVPSNITHSLLIPRLWIKSAPYSFVRHFRTRLTVTCVVVLCATHDGIQGCVALLTVCIGM